LAYRDLREYLARLDETGHLWKIKTEVDKDWEIAAVARRVFQKVPEERRKGLLFENKIVGGVVPREYVGAVEKGVKEAMEAGVLAGYPVVDVGVRLVDGSYHEVDSSEIAFKIAGSMAVKDAARKAKPVLLEPIMSIEVIVPEEYMGEVIGDLNARRGRIKHMEARAGAQVIEGEVPLATMFGYATSLRSATQGRANYTMQFSHYREVPNSIAAEIIEKR